MEGTNGQQQADVGVILLSYNRPQMLQIAWESIASQGRYPIILVDDGSDAFDVGAWADAHGIPSRLRILGAKRSVAHRMSQAVLGRLINGALWTAAMRLRLRAVAYLCDDDLFEPGWLGHVSDVLSDETGHHVVRGRWKAFKDPLTGAPLARPKRARPADLDVRRMTTGNFAHRLDCYREGLRWSEETVAVHDDTFIWRLLSLHAPASPEFADSDVLAGYRRIHRYNGANYTAHSEYAVGAYEWLSRGRLE